MIVDRIKEYIDKSGISVAAFERSIGMSNASFGKSLKNKGAIGTDKLENILSVYPTINPTWLLTGEGPMLKSSTPKPSEAAPKPQAAATTPPSSPRREKDGKPSAADDAATFLAYIKDREDTHRAEIREKDTVIAQQNLEIRSLDRKLALAEGENRHLSLDNDRLAHDLDTLRQEVAHLRSAHP